MPRRPCPHPADPAWPPARKAQLRRTVWKKMRRFRNSKEFALLEAREAARAKTLPEEGINEEAPGLATGGSLDLVIPGEDPGPPKMRALAAVPARRAPPPAQGWGGTTVSTD